jgi:putative transposase
VTARYEFIDGEKATLTGAGDRKYSLVKMCAWMEVSTSGFYDWWDRPRSATAKRRDFLGLVIAKAFADSDGTYGYRRVHAQLARWGEAASPELVRVLMRAAGLVACQPRPWRYNLTQSGPSGPIPDLVSRDFTAQRPGAKMVGDVTYIPTLGRLAVFGDGPRLPHERCGRVGHGRQLQDPAGLRRDRYGRP